MEASFQALNLPQRISLHIHISRCNERVVNSAQTRAYQVCHNYSATDSRDEAASLQEGNRLANAKAKYQDSWLFANCRQNIMMHSTHDANN